LRLPHRHHNPAQSSRRRFNQLRAGRHALFERQRSVADAHHGINPLRQHIFGPVAQSAGNAEYRRSMRFGDFGDADRRFAERLND